MKASLLHRVLAATSLAIGFGLAWAAVVFWIGATAIDAWPGGQGAHVENLVVAADGAPLIQDYSLANLSNVSYRGLDGVAIGNIDRKQMAEPMSLAGEVEPPGFWSPRDWRQRLWAFVNDREPAAVWYLASDGGAPESGWFVGFERVSNRRIGFIGLAGFRDQPIPPEERFPLQANGGSFVASNSLPTSINMNNNWRPPLPGPQDVPPRLVHIPSGSVLRVVDLDEGTTRTVFEAPAPITSVAVPMLSAYYGYAPAKEPRILVRAGDKVYKLDREYRTVGVAPMPAGIGPKDAATWHDVGDGRAVVTTFLTQPNADDLLRNGVTTRVYRLAADGTVQESIDVELRNGSAPLPQGAESALTAVGLPAPALVLATQALVAAPIRPEGYPSRLANQLRKTWPALAAVSLLAIGLAAAAWKRSVAFGLPHRERFVWTVLTALFGVPAFVGFLLHRTWPPREPCPHCRSLVPRDRCECEGCGIPFPSPSLSGTEIFA